LEIVERSPTRTASSTASAGPAPIAASGADGP